MAEASNPALQLHQLLSRWAEDLPQTAILNARTEDGNWWTPHVRAIGWLDAVDNHLIATDEEGDEVETEALWRLRRGILATHWTMITGANTNVFEPMDLSLLRRIGRGWTHVMVDSSLTREMDQIVGELLDLAQKLDGDDESRRYILELGVGMKKALTELNYFGETGVRALANQLIGALTVAFDLNETDPDAKGQSVKLRKRLAEQAAAFGRIFRDSAAKTLGTGAVVFLALPPGSTPLN